MADNTGEVEILFDDESNTYHAFWYPPKAIGSGKTVQDALTDLQNAIHFGVDTLLDSIRQRENALNGQ